MQIVQVSAPELAFGNGWRSTLVANREAVRTSPVRRRLHFGSPMADQEERQENERRLKLELDQMHNEQKRRWNFDFANEKPLRGQFLWQVVTDESALVKSAKRHAGPTSMDGGAKRSKMVDVRLVQLDLVNQNGRPVSHLHGQTKITDFMKRSKKSQDSSKTAEPFDQSAPRTASIN